MELIAEELAGDGTTELDTSPEEPTGDEIIEAEPEATELDAAAEIDPIDKALWAAEVDSDADDAVRDDTAVFVAIAEEPDADNTTEVDSVVPELLRSVSTELDPLAEKPIVNEPTAEELAEGVTELDPAAVLMGVPEDSIELIPTVELDPDAVDPVAEEPTRKDPDGDDDTTELEPAAKELPGEDPVVLDPTAVLDPAAVLDPLIEKPTEDELAAEELAGNETNALDPTEP